MCVNVCEGVCKCVFMGLTFAVKRLLEGNRERQRESVACVEGALRMKERKNRIEL